MASQDKSKKISKGAAVVNRSGAGGPDSEPRKNLPVSASQDATAEADSATLRATIAAQRWDIAGLKEQLARAVEEHEKTGKARRQAESAQAAEIARLQQALGEAQAGARASTAQATIYRSMFERLHAAVFHDFWAAFPRPAAGVELFHAMITVWQSGLFDEAYYRSQGSNPDIPPGMPALAHYLLYGERQGRSPHPLFDLRHYRSQFSPDDAPENALLHYLGSGRDLAPNPLFDARYYLRHHDELADAAINPLVHYLNVGAAAGSRPHPLFDPDYYAEQVVADGGERPQQPLAHYLASPGSTASPHPLFDARFYLSSHPEAGAAGVAALVHFLIDGDRNGWKPHRWFDPTYYRETTPDITEGGVNTLVHFVLTGADQRRSPSPAFDFAFYRAQCDEAVGEQIGSRLFLDFLRAGMAAGRSPHPLIDLASIRRQLGGAPLDPDGLWRILSARRVAIRGGSGRGSTPGRVLAPHWLFDPDYYQHQLPEAAEFADGPLLFYLSRGWNGDARPHPLFDPGYYRAQAAQRGIAIDDPLAHFAEFGGSMGLSPHPLFNADFYLATNPDIEAGTNPLRHYLTRGDREDRDPHPLFSVASYRSAAKLDAETNSLIHYLERGATASIDPHPLFDTAYFLAQLRAGLPAQTTPLAHYLTAPEAMRASPHPLFDPDYFRAQLPDAIPEGTPPLVHYLTRAMLQAPAPHPAFDPDFFAGGGETTRGREPALAVYVRAWRRLQQSGVLLQRIRLREANREFCSISYLLDHPRLLNGSEIPLAHYLRHAGWPTGAKLRPGRRDSSARSTGAIAEGYRPASYVPASFREAARTQLDRGLGHLGTDDPVFRLQKSDWTEAFAALWHGAAPLATIAGDDPALIGRMKGSRRIVLYAMNAPEGRLNAYHRAMLSELSEAGYATIVINRTTADAADAAGHGAAAVIVHSGEGGDFASWLVALLHVAPALAEADHVLLLNDSLVGPFGELRPLLQALENHSADLLGLTESLEGGRHWQRAFLHLSRHALFSAGFLQFMLSFAASLASRSHKGLPARHAEQHLLARLTTGGVGSAAWRPYADAEENWLASLPERLARAASLPAHREEWRLDRLFDRALAPRLADYLGDWLTERAAFLRAGERMNPLHIFWDSLFDPAGFPFIAKELLLTNPLHVPTIIGLPDLLIRHARTQDVALLHDLLAPPSEGRPTAYFRLSWRLIQGIA